MISVLRHSIASPIRLNVSPVERADVDVVDVQSCISFATVPVEGEDPSMKRGKGKVQLQLVDVTSTNV